MYNRTIWKDSVRDPERTYKQTANADGTVTIIPAGKQIQQGTNQSAHNFNGMEEGILDAHLAEAIMIQYQMQINRDHDSRIISMEGDNAVETGTVTLSNTAKYPFNNSIKTVALAKTKNTVNYDVEFEITGHTGGIPGDVEVSEKALNGFKLSFDGSAASVTVKYMVKGGIYS